MTSPTPKKLHLHPIDLRPVWPVRPAEPQSYLEIEAEEAARVERLARAGRIWEITRQIAQGTNVSSPLPPLAPLPGIEYIPRTEHPGPPDGRPWVYNPARQGWTLLSDLSPVEDLPPDAVVHVQAGFAPVDVSFTAQALAEQQAQQGLDTAAMGGLAGAGQHAAAEPMVYLVAFDEVLPLSEAKRRWEAHCAADEQDDTAPCEVA